MSNWILIAAGKSLFTAFDAIAPGRGHASDGSIGDAAHQREVSDHNPDETGAVPIHDADHINEVHAIDVDSALNEPGLTMEMVVQHILGRCRAGLEQRLRYVIYNRRIWEADRGWQERPYNGSSPHTEHAHFSFSYVTSLEASTVSWHLEDIPVALTDMDLAKIRTMILAPFVDSDATGLVETPAGHELLSQQVPDGTVAGSPQAATYVVLQHLGQAIKRVEDKVDALAAKTQPPAKA